MMERDIKTTPFRMTRDSRVLLAKWLHAYILPEEFLDTLPKIGLMVFYCNTPIGVAFLRTVEGGKGMIDGFLTDPQSDLTVRNACLDQLIIDLIKVAKYNEMSGIFGLTTNKRVVARAKKLGFSLMEHKLVSLKCFAWNNMGVQ